MIKLLFLLIIICFTSCEKQTTDTQSDDSALNNVDISRQSDISTPINSESPDSFSQDMIEAEANKLLTEFDTDDPIEAYCAFMRGELLAVFWNSEYTFTMNELNWYGTNIPWVVEYAFYNFTNTDAIDLIITGSAPQGYRILTFIDKHVVYYNYGSQYSKALVNGAFLYFRSEMGEERYRYEAPEEKDKIQFDYYPPIMMNGEMLEAIYIFQGEEISQQEWEELIKPYLSIPPADITWHSIEEILSAPINTKPPDFLQQDMIESNLIEFPIKIDTDNSIETNLLRQLR